MRIKLPPDLQDEIASIVPLEPGMEQAAQKHLDSLTKPLGSLGRLEELACRLYAIQREKPLAARPARMFTIAGDHGVVREGVAVSPQSVTVSMVENFLRGGAAINCLCAAAGADLRVVDAGVAAPAFAEHPALVNAKIAHGTANMAAGPAMRPDECEKAVRLGISLAESARSENVRAVGTGEMGIGNTTASSALFCAYLGFAASDMTGMGAGVPQAGLAHKTGVIEKALQANADAVRSNDPFAILAALGGLEIAALTGLILGSASRRMAVVIDGFIATAAYTAAWKTAPAVRDYCFFSHGSAEAGHGKVLACLGEKPLVDLGMRLGEGSGAAIGLFLLEAACRIFNDMSTLADAGIDLA